MASIAVFDHGTEVPGYPQLFCRAEGDVTASIFDPVETPIWTIRATLADGARLSWPAEHGDEALRVLEGSLETDAGRCETGDAVIIEAGVETSVRAVGRTRILHMGSNLATPPTEGPLGAPEADGHRVHLLRRADVYTVSREDSGAAMVARMFADSSCPTCRLHLLEVGFDGPMASASHMHSEDELLHVLEGSLRAGRVHVPAGSTVFVPGGLRYAIRSDVACTLVNFRRDASTVVFTPGEEPHLETVGAARDASGDTASRPDVMRLGSS
jgi:mannose-6-phosphate isomerase-like protein (cupin superfamily)